MPIGLLESANFRPVLVVLGRSRRERVFVGELEGTKFPSELALAFISEISGDALSEGILIAPGTFKGFDRLQAEQQILGLKTQFKEYASVQLRDIAVEINTVKRGEEHTVKDNAIYVPMLGQSAVTHDISQVSINHQNVFQVVLSEIANSEYLSAFFQSQLGKLVLSSLQHGTVNRRIRTSDFADAKVALPPLDEQTRIAFTHKRLSDLKCAISDFQCELALNPRSAEAIESQLEGMLEHIGKLSNADKILVLVRAKEVGELTVEFKETFSLNVKDLREIKSKDDVIETSALKSIVAFLNSKGGVLLVGVTDPGEVIGIGEEMSLFHRNDRDKFLQYFANKVNSRIGKEYWVHIRHELVEVLGVYVLMVECKEAQRPCFLDRKSFFVRTKAVTIELTVPQALDYCEARFRNQDG